MRKTPVSTHRMSLGRLIGQTNHIMASDAGHELTPTYTKLDNVQTARPIAEPCIKSRKEKKQNMVKLSAWSVGMHIKKCDFS